MSVNTALVNALESLLPTSADVYKGDAAEYIVFNYTTIPDDFGDDDAQYYRYLVQVDLYAPYEKNTLNYRRQITSRLVAAGFTRPTITPAHDEKGQHYIFDCEYAEAVESG